MFCLIFFFLFMDISWVIDVMKYVVFCVLLGIEELNCNDNFFYYCCVIK